MSEERKFEIEVLTRLTKIETMLEDFKGIEQKANDAYNLSKQNQEKINKIEDKNQWAFRTSIGAVIGAVISGIISIVFAVINLK